MYEYVKDYPQVYEFKSVWVDKISMCGSEYGIGYSAADSSVNEDYFKICSILGQGRCVLYEESTYKYALKMVDASKHKDLAEEVRSEASIYK